MKASILDKLDLLAERYEEVGALLSDSEIISNQDKFRGLSKEYAELEPVVQTYGRFQETVTDIDEAKNLLKDADPDMRAMASEEVNAGEAKQEELELDLQRLLYLRTLMMGRMYSWRFVLAPVETRQPFFPVIYFECTASLLKTIAGKSKLLAKTKVTMADIKRLSLEWLVKGCTLSLNLSLALIVFKEFPILSLRGEFIRLLVPSPLWLRLMRRMRLRSTSQIFE